MEFLLPAIYSTGSVSFGMTLSPYQLEIEQQFSTIFKSRSPKLILYAFGQGPPSRLVKLVKIVKQCFNCSQFCWGPPWTSPKDPTLRTTAVVPDKLTKPDLIKPRNLPYSDEDASYSMLPTIMRQSQAAIFPKNAPYLQLQMRRSWSSPEP